MIHKFTLLALAVTALFIAGCGKSSSEKDDGSKTKQGAMNPDGTKGDKGAEAKNADK